MRSSSVVLPNLPEYQNPSAWALQEAMRLVRDFLKGTGVKALLFGSRARGDAKGFSDIDIALSAGDHPVPGSLVALLSEAFEASRIPYNVDLVDLYNAGPELKQAVEREGTQWTA
jgi:predicted nucleotidyltransferase